MEQDRRDMHHGDRRGPTSFLGTKIDSIAATNRDSQPSRADPLTGPSSTRLLPTNCERACLAWSSVRPNPETSSEECEALVTHDRSVHDILV